MTCRKRLGNAVAEFDVSHEDRGLAFAADGRTAEKLIAKVKPGGVFATVARAPQNAAMAEAVRDGKLAIPISENLPLRQAAEAQAAAEKGVAGKILPVA